MKIIKITKDILIDYCKDPLSIDSKCLYANITGDLDFGSLYPSVIGRCKGNDLIDFVTYIRSEYVFSFLTPIKITQSILDHIDRIVDKVNNGEIAPVMSIESVEIMRSKLIEWQDNKGK